MNNKQKNILWLALIIITGVLFRMYQLGTESLWLDEIATALRVQMSWSEMFSVLIKIKGNPPFHYVLLKGWVGIFGSSEFSFRFISAVFSALSIVLFYRIAKMLFSEKVALLAAAILALSRYHIDFAQEARCYALMGFLVLLSMYFLIHLWQNPTWGSYIGYILATVAMLYNHYYAPFVIIMQNLFILTIYLLRKPIRWKYLLYWFIGQAVIGLCYLPWMAVLWQAINKIESVPTVLQTPGLANMAACFRKFSGGTKLAVYLFFVLACLSCFTILKTGIRRTDSQTTETSSQQNIFTSYYLVLLWLAVPILLPFIYSVYRAPIFSSRYTLISSYPFYLMIAITIAGVKIKCLRWLLIGFLLSVSIRVLVPRYFVHNFEEWRQATSYVESKAKPGQALLFHAPFCGNIGYGFYAKRTDLPILGVPYDAGSNCAVTESNVKAIAPLIETYTHVWLILSHSRDKEGYILDQMRKDYSQIEHVSFNRIEVYLFKIDETPPPSLLPD